MTFEHLRAAREAIPFQPFTIFLAGGKSFRVPHRDYLSLHPNGGRTVIVYQDKAFSILDVRLITELGFEQEPAPAGGNGTTDPQPLQS